MAAQNEVPRCSPVWVKGVQDNTCPQQALSYSIAITHRLGYRDILSTDWLLSNQNHTYILCIVHWQKACMKGPISRKGRVLLPFRLRIYSRLALWVLPHNFMNNSNLTEHKQIHVRLVFQIPASTIEGEERNRNVVFPHRPFQTAWLIEGQRQNATKAASDAAWKDRWGVRTNTRVVMLCSWSCGAFG